MKKVNKVLLIILVGILLGYGMYQLNPKLLGADSGFDSSYGGSSSSSSSSSSHSSSSRSSSSFDFGSSSESLSPEAGLMQITCMVIFLIIFGVLIYKKIKKVSKEIKELSEAKDKLYAKYLGNTNKFLEGRFKDYKAVQIAWMDFDYKTLKDKLTDELYNQYEMQLETLKIQNERNVMKNIEYIDSELHNIFVENGIITVAIHLSVVQIDYIEKDGVCVRGNADEANFVEYIIHYVSRVDKDDMKCPSCGNPLDDISSQTCKFCHSTMTLTPKKWVMAKKEVVRERR